MPNLIINPEDAQPAQNNASNSSIPQQSGNIGQNQAIEAPKLNILPEDAKPAQVAQTSRLEALAKGAQLGIDTFSSSIQKLVANTFPNAYKRGVAGAEAVTGDKTIPKTAKDIQNAYKQEVSDYSNNPSVRAHPIIATEGQIGGGLLAT